MCVDEKTALHVAEYEGRRVVFRSQRCRERYFENPVAYAA
jgi:YHS domain-containing protein